MTDNTLQPMADDAKHVLRSRTMWVNALALALAAAEDHVGLLSNVLPINTYQLLAFALPVINAVLRLVTTQGVKL